MRALTARSLEYTRLQFLRAVKRTGSREKDKRGRMSLVYVEATRELGIYIGKGVIGGEENLKLRRFCCWKSGIN